MCQGGQPFPSPISREGQTAPAFWWDWICFRGCFWKAHFLLRLSQVHPIIAEEARQATVSQAWSSVKWQRDPPSSVTAGICCKMLSHQGAKGPPSSLTWITPSPGSHRVNILTRPRNSAKRLAVSLTFKSQVVLTSHGLCVEGQTVHSGALEKVTSEPASKSLHKNPLFSTVSQPSLEALMSLFVNYLVMGND